MLHKTSDRTLMGQSALWVPLSSAHEQARPGSYSKVMQTCRLRPLMNSAHRSPWLGTVAVPVLRRPATASGFDSQHAPGRSISTTLDGQSYAERREAVSRYRMLSTPPAGPATVLTQQIIPKRPAPVNDTAQSGGSRLRAGVDGDSDLPTVLDGCWTYKTVW